MENILVATRRTEAGSVRVRRLRRSGLLPGNMNSTAGETTSIQLNRHDFEQMLRHHKSESLIMDVQIDGKAMGKALLKEVQHDPVTGAVIHIDLLEVSMTKRMRVEIPVTLVGDPPGEELGGTLEQLLREVEVECLPGDLVENIELDVSGLNIGDSLSVRDLKVDATLTILTSPDLAVASVLAPRVEAEVEEVVEEGVTAVEPELVGKKAKEEEPEES